MPSHKQEVYAVLVQKVGSFVGDGLKELAASRSVSYIALIVEKHPVNHQNCRVLCVTTLPSGSPFCKRA